MLNVYGSGVSSWMFLENNLASLYAGALHQFTIGLISWSVLCSFIRPRMVGAEGFRLMYFHLVSELMSLGLLLIVFLICFWKDLVGFLLVGNCYC
jgi:hypothetical protein